MHSHAILKIFSTLITLLASYTSAQSTTAPTEPNPEPTCADPTATCLAYGVDFHNGGSYFQNTASNDPFTFVSQFSGCANDIAQNILVDPNGAQYACSNTTLTPDFTNQLSTCQELKSSMFSGEWSVIIVSNNGGCAPFDAQRSFSISAGPQATVTYTPTVMLTSTTTPVVVSTSTDTVTATVTPASTKRGLQVPHVPAVQTATPTTLTVLQSHFTIPSHAIHTFTIPCVIPTRAPNADQHAWIIPTILPLPFQSWASSLIGRSPPEPTTPPRLSEREAKVNRKDKRAPDSPTITVTDSNTADFVTSTSVVTASAITSFTEVETTVTVTVTASVAGGMGTSTKSVTPVETSSTTVTTVPTVTIGTRPWDAVQSCRARGGWMR